MADALARRGALSAAIYALLALLIFVTTAIGRDISAIGTIAAMFAIGVLRLALAIAYLKDKVGMVRFRRWWRIGALVAAGQWGGCAGLVVLHGLDTDALIVLLTTAGIAAGSTSSLSPDLRCLRWYLLALLGPPIACVLSLRVGPALGAGASMTIFLLFLVIQAGDLHRHFVEMLDSRRLLEERARAVDEQRAIADEANQAKTEFLANMSHEIRTPLTAVIGYAELLIGDVTASERIEYAEIIRRNGAHLLGVLNAVLDLSKIEAGRMTVELGACNMIEALSDVESTLRVRAIDRGIDFELSLDTAVPQMIQADPTRVRQILLNLAGNAIKFTEKGRVSIRVRHDRELKISIEDTGSGISSKDLARLFSPFTQIESASNRKHQGTGLGLHISREFARLMGGDVSAESELGRGSVFTLRLPVRDQDLTQMCSSLRVRRDVVSLAPPPTDRPLEGIRVLLAEDGMDNQRLVSMLLRRAGAEVDVASDGLEAVRAVTSHPDIYAVVLMDMEMPELDGYGATARLRSLGHRGPIIALTAHALAGHRERCLAAGCDEHLTKPIDRNAVVAMVARFAGPRRAPSLQPLVSSLQDEADFQELLANYCKSLKQHAETLRAALAKEDITAMEKLAHELAGSGGSYGFQPITVAARLLEQALRRGERYADAALGLVTLCQRGASSY